MKSLLEMLSLLPRMITSSMQLIMCINVTTES
ncbi:unnamed protein product [Trichobilharzia regenti]|nr:unnamed protein product [Trichobilharzia regenti]